MSSSVNYVIKPSTAVSEVSSNTECHIFVSLMSDSMTVTNLDLLSNRICPDREREETILMLANEDRDYFIETLKNPPSPNQKLKDAFDFYDAKFKDE